MTLAYSKTTKLISFWLFHDLSVLKDYKLASHSFMTLAYSKTTNLSHRQSIPFWTCFGVFCLRLLPEVLSSASLPLPACCSFHFKFPSELFYVSSWVLCSSVPKWLLSGQTMPLWAYCVWWDPFSEDCFVRVHRSWSFSHQLRQARMQPWTLHWER